MNLFKIAKFDLINNLKNIVFVIAYILFPSILLTGLSFLTKNKYGSLSFSSYDFYGITMCIFLCLFISQLLSNSFTDESIKYVNMRVIYSPTSKTSIFLSKTISSFIFGTILFSIFVLFESLILKVNFGGVYSIYIFILILVFLFFMCCVGTFICCLIPNGDLANKIITLICVLYAGFGGVFIPLGHFGKIVQFISYLSPVRLVWKCCFEIIYDKNFSLFVPGIVSLSIISIILLLLCKIIFRPEEYI